MPKLFVICGHGAGDPGAGGYGYNEAERVRALATRMKALGGSDVEIGDTSRNWYADGGVNTLKVDCPVIELHMDSADGSARGGHVIISSKFSADQYDNALASFIGGMFPGRSQTIVQRSNLANINRAANRGINYRLLECCFISNRDDLNRFNNDMDTLARGILNAFGIGVKSAMGWVSENGRWWYSLPDGTWYKDEWKEINGHWYWFDSDGYAATGWRLIDGLWYWFYRKDQRNGYPECSMAESCVLDIWGEYYAFGSDGAMLTNITVAENGHLEL